MRHERWATIPAAPKYEVSTRGQVRNIKSGKVLKRIWNAGSLVYRLHVGGGKRRNFTKAALQWLVHGLDIGKQRGLKVAVTLRKSNRRYIFDTIKAAAFFISNEERSLAPATVSNKLVARKKVILGWQVTYLR